MATTAGPLAASAQQRGFWLANELDPGSPAFNLVRLLRISGMLDERALEAALDRLVDRHEVLRTALVETDGAVGQHILTRAKVTLRRKDLTSLAPDERNPACEALAARLGQEGFDLAAPPLFRGVLIRLGQDEHVLALSFHHAVIDGWSMAIFFDELAAFYRSEVQGLSPGLKELRLQYSDYAAWQEREHASRAFQDGVAYWRHTLAGAPPLLALPTRGPRAATESHRGQRLGFTLELDLVRKLRLVCSAHRATLFMGLLAAFQVLLRRYAETEDVIVGTPVAGRNHEDLGDLIGCFVNTVALRGDLSGNPSFSGLLARTRETTIKAFEHQDIPFESVVAELKCSRTRSQQPIYQVMLVLQNARAQVPRLPGLVVDELELDPGLAKLDLTLEAIEGNEGLSCSFEYNSQLFDRALIESMAGHFRRIVSAVADDPGRPIDSISLLSEQEWRRAVFEWNDTRRDLGPEQSPDEAFAAIAAEMNERVALVEGDRRVSFAELARRAGQVARALVEDGYHDDQPVGVLMPRSAATVAAMLGCLQAGVPWVPLDTAQPARRLQALIEGAGCRAVLTLGALQDRLPAGIEPILLDADAPVWRAEPTAERHGGGSDLAYVLFTSGSTGVPKGVMGSKRAMMNRLRWMYAAFPFQPGETCCCKTSIGFVDSVWEMFGPLLAGVPSVIVPDEAVLDPVAFVALLRQHRVTRIVLVPTLLRVLLDAVPDLGTQLPDLATWSVSGEVLAPDLARSFMRACPGRRLINIYGSSEVAADVLVHEVGEADLGGAIPIGRPIANTQVYVLNPAGQPAPVGLPGVIHVGGDCLALGYWRRPDLTAERFVTKSGPGAPPGLLFNTGDRGSYRRDGVILYGGRNDGQVKLRGVRIEMGEILSALREHPSVKDAAATIVGESGAERLVGFVVGHGSGPSPDPAELHRQLRDRLPVAMVPAALRVVDALPLLPGGKVDTMALARLAETQTGSVAAKVAATDAVLPDVADIWRKLLREDEIGPDSDFFELGGNSLLAVQVIVRVRRHFGVQIPIRALFDNPTLAEFSRMVGAAPRADGEVQSGIMPFVRPRPALGDLQARLAQLSPEELDQLLKSVRKEMG